MLHNSGYGGWARIIWRGPGRRDVGERWDRVRDSTYKGAWVAFAHKIGQAQPSYRRDWNSAAILLREIEPDHQLDDAQASVELCRRIEACAGALNLPPNLLLAGRAHSGQETLSVHDPLLTWMFLAKSTGQVWLRSRPPQISRLQTPTLIEPGGTPTRGLYWSCALWFPGGIPDEFIKVGTGHKDHKLPQGMPR